MSCCADALCPTNDLVRYRDPMQRPAVPAGSDFALSTPGFLKRGIRADSDIGSQAVVVMIDLFEQSGNDLHRRQFPAGYESGKSCSGHEDQVRWHGTSLPARRCSRATHHNDCHQGTIQLDRKSTRLNSSHSQISYAVFCLKKKKYINTTNSYNTHKC